MTTQLDREAAQIMAANLAGLVGKNLIALEMREDGSVRIHQHTPDSVSPQSDYPDARKAVARVLQLLHIGPVAPQTWPEEACIGSVATGGGDD